MAKKAILFARVSSSVQTYDRQLSDLLPLIKQDGYTDEDIAIISHKESATKNNVQNRKSISELKELICSNPIEAVYVTEASRLSRRGDVMYAVLALLEERQISLVIQTPTIIRTYENGKPNALAHVVIAFLSQVAQAESELKLERQKSGYAQKIKDGKVVSSKVKFGYIRENGFAKPNPEQVKVVHDIFKMYLNDQSVTTIWEYYQHSGIFPNIPNKSGWGKITKILRDTTYVGENKHFNYPAIMDKELFDKVQSKMDDSQLVKTNLMNVYYCQRLIKIDGHCMTPNATQACYSYRNCDTGKTCSINANVVDSLALTLACEALSSMMQTTNQQRRENAAERLKMAKNKVSGIVDSIADNEKEQERLNYVFTKGKMSEDKYLFEMERVEGELAHLLKEQEELAILQTQLESVISETGGAMQASKDYNALMQVTDDHERQRIVKEAIEEIVLTKIDKGYDMHVEYIDKSLNDEVIYRYIQKGCKIHLYAMYEDVYEDYTGCWEQRIKPLYKRRKESN